jgi:UDP-N-acetylmuramoylalanine-D-glutamate ligase
MIITLRIINIDDLVLPGEHNLENILAAVLASILAGVPIKANLYLYIVICDLYQKMSLNYL